MMRAARAMTAPCTTERPTPPKPKTATVDPALDLRGVEHRADAGGEDAAEKAHLVERRRGIDPGDGDFGQHDVLGERARAHVMQHGPALQRESRRAVRHQARALASRAAGCIDWSCGSTGTPRTSRIRARRAGSRGRRARTLVTPRPTSSTMPPPSCPRITGNSPSGSAPDSVNASVWHTPEATIRTSTSPALGPARSTLSIVKGLPASQATAALVFTRRAPCMRHPALDHSSLRASRERGAHRSRAGSINCRSHGGGRDAAARRHRRRVTKCAAARPGPALFLIQDRVRQIWPCGGTVRRPRAGIGSLRRLRQSHRFPRIDPPRRGAPRLRRIRWILRRPN